MSPKVTAQAIVERILSSVDRLCQDNWDCFRAASYLLALDGTDAKNAVRRFAARMKAHPALPRETFWDNVDGLLEMPAVDRCLAHVKAFQRTHALAFLLPPANRIEEIVKTLVQINNEQQPSAEIPLGSYLLAALWALNGADSAVATKLLPSIKPDWWIEKSEYSRVYSKFYLEQSHPIAPHPFWTHPLHPAITRDMLCGAWMKTAFGADPLEIFHAELMPNLPGKWLLWGDIDRLRHLNDVEGHLAGDIAIRGTAQTLQGSVGDRVIRFGGQQFIILDDGPDGPASAEQLRTLVEGTAYAPLGHLKDPVRVTISFGVSKITENRSCIEAAEEAAYQAKSNGRNCVVMAE